MRPTNDRKNIPIVFHFLYQILKLEKETIIDMYNELNECLGFVERALDMRDSEIAILKGDIETFELD